MGSGQFMNKEYKCPISSMWITREWQRILPEVNVKGFNFYCTSNVIDENENDDDDDDDDDDVGAVMRMGIFGVSVRKIKALTVKIVTRIGKGK